MLLVILFYHKSQKSQEKKLNLLNKIKSPKIREKVLSILLAKKPQHRDRVWLVGFLNYVGYNDREIFEIVKKLNCWCDFNEKITRYQIQSVIRSSKNGKRINAFFSPLTRVGGGGGSGSYEKDLIHKGKIKPCELIKEV